MKPYRAIRYKCDFCKKTSGAKHVMTRHEKKCTKNPNRICGMCAIYNQISPKIEELKSVLPERSELVTQPMSSVDYDYSVSICNESLKKLRSLVSCPNCILAAIRQKGIPVPMFSDFQYKKEFGEWITKG